MPLSGQKDTRQVTPTWDAIAERIEGVRAKDVRNVVTRNGHTTELFRRDWGVVEGEIDHMIHVELRGAAISAWHRHELQTDHIFVVSGLVKLVLFDSREGSPTHGQVDVFHLSLMRPELVVIPLGVWHGIQNMSTETSSFINFFDREYSYDDPDEYRLPPDAPEIPYRF